MELDEETEEVAGDLIAGLIEALDGIDVRAVCAALEEVLGLARQQLVDRVA